MAQPTRFTRVERRRAILVALEHHGLALPAADAACTTGARMRGQTLRTRLEYAVLMDAATGEQVADPVEGGEDEVDLRDQFARCRPDRLYVGVHTHPRSQPFSLGDIALLLRQPALCAVSAVGRGGTWYFMSVEPGHPVPSIDALRSTLEPHLEALGEQYTSPPYPNPMAGRRDHYHAAWQKAVSELGLRYDRIEGRSSGA